MTGPMFGSLAVRVVAVRPVSIHGDVYFDVRVAADGDEAPLDLRVPVHLCADQPTPGDRATIAFLMGQVSEWTPA